MTIEEMCAAFDFSGINANNAILDPVKLNWMNSQYIMKLDSHHLVERIAPILIQKGLATKYWIETRWQWMMKVVDALRERCTTLTEFAEKGRYFFTADFEYDPEGVSKRFVNPALAEHLDLIRRAFSARTDLGKTEAEQIIRQKAQEWGLKPADLIHPLRLALTGITGGPGLFEIIELLGQPEVDKRLSRAIDFIRSLP